MSEPVVVKLRKPIKYGDRVVGQIAIRPVKAKDLRRMKGSQTTLQATLDMASWLSGEISEVIDELEGEDLAEVIGAVDGFFGKLRGTGPTSSEP